MGLTRVAVRVPSGAWAMSLRVMDMGARLYQPGALRASLPSLRSQSYS